MRKEKQRNPKITKKKKIQNQKKKRGVGERPFFFYPPSTILVRQRRRMRSQRTAPGRGEEGPKKEEEEEENKGWVSHFLSIHILVCFFLTHRHPQTHTHTHTHAHTHTHTHTPDQTGRPAWRRWETRQAWPSWTQRRSWTPPLDPVVCAKERDVSIGWFAFLCFCNLLLLFVCLLVLLFVCLLLFCFFVVCLFVCLLAHLLVCFCCSCTSSKIPLILIFLPPSSTHTLTLGAKGALTFLSLISVQSYFCFLKNACCSRSDLPFGPDPSRSAGLRHSRCAMNCVFTVCVCVCVWQVECWWILLLIDWLIDWLIGWLIDWLSK